MGRNKSTPRTNKKQRSRNPLTPELKAAKKAARNRRRRARKKEMLQEVARR